MTREKILIIGTGALATLFAARLSGGGIQVTILGRWKASLEAFQQNGAQIEGEPAQYVDAISDPRECSFIKQSMVLVEPRQTNEAALDLFPCLAEDGSTLTLQNGLGNKEKLISVLGEERIVSGVTTIGARLIAPGLVKPSGKSTIWMEHHSRVNLLAIMLRNCGFKIHLVDDIQPFVWRKLIVNCAINPLTAILRVKNGELLKDPLTKILLDRLVEEVVSVSKFLNIQLGIKDPQKMVKTVAQQTSENFSSMLQDILRGVTTEIDALNGEIIRLGEIYGVDVSLNKLVFKLVEERRKLSSVELSDMVDRTINLARD